MRNIQDTFKTRKRSFISAFLICMTVPLTTFHKVFHHDIAMFLPSDKLHLTVKRNFLSYIINICKNMFYE